MKKYKTKLKHDFIECLMVVIDAAIVNWKDEDDKMFTCLLAEIKERLYKKTFQVQKEYTISFSPAQAFALRLLSSWFNDHTKYFDNRLNQISNEVHKEYA